MKDIKKANSGSQCRSSDGERISQPSLFEKKGTSQETVETTGHSGIGEGCVAVYARVSSEQQEKDETIESQMAILQAYAKEHEME